MKTRFFAMFAAACVATCMLVPAQAASPNDSSGIDIKHAVPADVFFAVYTRHNPLRDYQRAYYADVFKTFQDEQIGPRLLNIITSRTPADKLNAAKEKLQEVETALAPISLQALLNANEFVAAERMDGPFNKILWAARLTTDDAADCERGVKQGFELMSRWSEGKLTVNTDQASGIEVTTLRLPKDSPFQPAVARDNNVVFASTNDVFLRSCLEQLQNKSAKSKFDDPRLQSAVAQLHQPDDSLVLFDAKQLSQSLHGVGDFIRAHSKDDPKAIRFAGVMDKAVDETAILDYIVTVEYTEPGHNHNMSLIKMADDYQNKVLGRALVSNQTISDWQKWVPNDATEYSIHHGINLHELYDGIIAFVREQFPESQGALDKFAAFQEKIGVNLDRDILQSFTGESVCVSMPVTMSDGTKKSASVTALKCQNPDKVRELLSRAVESLSKLPALQMQQLKLEDCKNLEGFQQLQASCFQMFGKQPVIGFRDGWMIIASCQEGAVKLLDVRAGKVDALNVSATFAKFGLDPKPALCSVSYNDVGAKVRAVADGIDKVGMMAPMFLGMAAANAKPEEIKPVQEAIGLLPSVAKVVRKFDFLDHSLKITRPGPMPNTYLQDSVMEIRPPKGS
jgi:hypothetical protein